MTIVCCGRSAKTLNDRRIIEGKCKCTLDTNIFQICRTLTFQAPSVHFAIFCEQNFHQGLSWHKTCRWTFVVISLHEAGRHVLVLLVLSFQPQGSHDDPKASHLESRAFTKAEHSQKQSIRINILSHLRSEVRRPLPQCTTCLSSMEKETSATGDASLKISQNHPADYEQLRVACD